MKQYLIAFAMVLALNSNTSATAQKHRHTPRTEQVSDTVKHSQNAIEAFSDTTTATANTNANEDDFDQHYRRTVTYETSGDDHVDKLVGGILGGIGGAAFLVPIIAILVFGLFLPIIILVLVFYFINRNRKEKYRLAQMAIQNGQPIPDQLLKDEMDSMISAGNRGMYNAGIRQMFTGIGLAIFLYMILGDLGLGIGALVFFIGLGKFIIARQSGNAPQSTIDNNPKNDEL